MLARREHSGQELVRKLVARGFAADLIDALLAGLIADGLLNDARFAEAFIHSRFQRGQGPRKIRLELRDRGIDETLIDDCLDGYESRWPMLIEQVRLKRFGAGLPADFSERSRQMRFLEQRGFTTELIAGVFREHEC